MSSSFIRHTFLKVSLVGSLVFSQSLFAQNYAQMVQEVNDALNSRCLNKNRTAVSIVAVPSGEVVYKRNETLPLLPASIMKIVTTASSLNYLGPEYRYKTQVLATGKRRDNTLQGDLILKGSGDPTLKTENLQAIVNDLKDSGLTTIQGNLIGDDSVFDGLDRSPYWSDDRTQQAYDASLSGLSLDYNTITVHVLPSDRTGSAANVWLKPHPEYITLNNLVKTSAQGNSLAARREGSDLQPVIQVAGRIGQGVQQQSLYLNIQAPTHYTINVFHKVLADAGIQVLGQTVQGVAPLNAEILFEHSSMPLSMILKELNTYSNNFMTEQVLKTVAAFKTGVGSHENGLRLSAEFLQQMGVNLQNVTLADGSGLSRQNQFTSEAMTELLNAMYKRFDVGPDFVTSLRVMGAYGTHSKRLSSSPAHANVRAKTGTLDGVSTLAGFVPNQATGELFAFTFLLNDNSCGYAGADKVEDKMVNAIYFYGQKPSAAGTLAAQR